MKVSPTTKVPIPYLNSDWGGTLSKIAMVHTNLRYYLVPSVPGSLGTPVLTNRSSTQQGLNGVSGSVGLVTQRTHWYLSDSCKLE